jgi:hypothetical protein
VRPKSVHFAMFQACSQVVGHESVERVRNKARELAEFPVWIAMWLPVRQQLRSQMSAEWNS